MHHSVTVMEDPCKCTTDTHSKTKIDGFVQGGLAGRCRRQLHSFSTYKNSLAIGAVMIVGMVTQYSMNGFEFQGPHVGMRFMNAIFNYAKG